MTAWKSVARSASANILSLKEGWKAEHTNTLAPQVSTNFSEVARKGRFITFCRVGSQRASAGAAEGWSTYHPKAGGSVSTTSSHRSAKRAVSESESCSATASSRRFGPYLPPTYSAAICISFSTSYLGRFKSDSDDREFQRTRARVL